MGLFDSIGDMLGMRNPASGAPNNLLGQVPQTLDPYFRPYINAGQGALGQLQGQYGNLINNPAGMMNQIGAGYHQSPGFQWQLNNALQAGNQSAAAGGMVGSPASQQQQMTTATGLANQDYYNYLNQALGQYGMGLQGLQGINQMGYGASTGLGENLGQNLMNRANLGYAGQANQNQMTGGLIGDVFGLFGGGGSPFSSGGAFAPGGRWG